MANTLQQAEFWKGFIIEKCQYPAPQILRAQFERATFSQFCDCGCHSFKVAVPMNESIPRLSDSSGYGAVFEAGFHIDDNKTLEIILFADEKGNLAFVEIDCCGNSYPVPEKFTVQEPPYDVHASNTLRL
jgi:hypothetical protein